MGKEEYKSKILYMVHCDTVDVAGVYESWYHLADVAGITCSDQSTT